MRNATKIQQKPTFWIALFFGVGIFCGLLWYVTPLELWRLVKQVDLNYVLLALIIKSVGTFFRAIQFGLFVPISGRFLSAYGVFSLTRFLNIALPFRAGEIIFLTLLKRSNLSPTIAGAIPMWLVLRVSDVIAIGVWFSVLIGLSRLGPEHGYVGYLAITGSLSALLMLHFAPSVLPSEINWPRNRWLRGRISALVDGLRHIRSASRKASAVAVSTLIWGSLISMSVAAQAAFDVPFDLWDRALIATFVLGLSILPINAPLGLGSGETIWAGVMVVFGLPLQQAVTLALGIRIIVLMISCFEGAIGLLIVWYQGIWPGNRIKVGGK